MHEGTVLWHLGDMTFHGKTLTMTWIVMAVLFIFCYLGVRNLTSGKPGKMQNILEWVVDFVRGLISDNIGLEKGRSLLAYLVTLIMFVFFANMFGLIPNLLMPVFRIFDVEFAKFNEIFGGPTLQSPTADINTTLALATLTIILVFAWGIKYKGSHYFRHFLEPHWLFLPIHIIDMLAKPMTLAFRLFGNIFAGEVLIGVILMLPGLWVLGGAVPDAIWLAFSIFVGSIQAFVFTVLTTAYIGQAVAEDH